MLLDEEKTYFRGVRSSVMKIMQSALRLYEKTGDPKFLEHAKWFGEKSVEFKKKI